jgi:site-specific DNA-methyltransferase (adenine-specific)
MIELHNIDCMEYLATLEDNAFELAIVDPPYGIGADSKNSGPNSKRHEKTSKAKINSYKSHGWDHAIPKKQYFTELKRVSKRQVIWGGNYFGLKGGFLYWHKNVTMPTYSQGELAWVSWLNKVDFVNISWHGMIQHDMKNKERRIHPTQKPVKLYEWLLHNYAKEGDRILDTHLGSGSSAIACHNGGFDMVGCELDTDYFNAAKKRLHQHQSQFRIF